MLIAAISIEYSGKRDLLDITTPLVDMLSYHIDNSVLTALEATIEGVSSSQLGFSQSSFKYPETKCSSQ